MHSAFAGVRPLVKSKDAVNTKKLIRDHEVEVDEVSGLVSVLGGKWTTYRAMAEDGINHAQRALADKQAACRTLDFLLTGAQGYSPDYWKQLAQDYRLSPETARHLAQKFGTDSPKVLELAKQEPQLLQSLFEGGIPIRAEVVYVIRERRWRRRSRTYFCEELVCSSTAGEKLHNPHPSWANCWPRSWPGATHKPRRRLPLTWVRSSTCSIAPGYRASVLKTSADLGFDPQAPRSR